MTVLDRTELEASSLADLHAIADQLGLEGFRRRRKAELIDAILTAAAGGASGGGDTDLAEPTAGAGDGAAGEEQAGGAGDEQAAVQNVPAQQKPSTAGRTRRRLSGVRGRRSRRAGGADEQTEPAASTAGGEADEPDDRGEAAYERGQADDERGKAGERGEAGLSEPSAAPSSRSAPSARAPVDRGIAEGVVELMGNGSAFLRVASPDVSEGDVYVSAAQVRRCELVDGDRVGGPVRAPRRSERYSSLVRVETINGVPAREVAEGARYEDRPVAYPSERLALEGGEAALEAIEWLTPFGKGSRALIVGPARAGKTVILKRLLGVFAGRDDLEVTLVLTGVRPEEIAEWSEGPVAPTTRLTFAAPAEVQAQAVERALDTARRTAARGGDALVLVDTLEGLHSPAARKALAAARNLADGGSLTILATAAHPLGGETTVIALDPALGLTGGPPLDLSASGTVRAELLVGEEGAAAIAQARANALAQS